MLFIAVLDGILDFATGIIHRLIEDLTHSLASTTVKKITSITQEVRCGIKHQLPGPSCSKLTMLLGEGSLKFQT